MRAFVWFSLIAGCSRSGVYVADEPPRSASFDSTVDDPDVLPDSPFEVDTSLAADTSVEDDARESGSPTAPSTLWYPGLVHPSVRGLLRVDLPGAASTSCGPLGPIDGFDVTRDGSLVAFVGEHEYRTLHSLYVARPDGSHLRELDEDVAWPPSFSPDGTKVGLANCFYDVETGTRRCVHGSGQWAWSPDSKRYAIGDQWFDVDDPGLAPHAMVPGGAPCSLGQVAFTGLHSFTVICAGEDRLWSVDPKKGWVARPSSATTVRGFTVTNDGMSVAYVTESGAWIVDGDFATSPTLLPTDLLAKDEKPDGPIRFSPDGSRIAFSVRSASTGDQALLVVPAGGGPMIRLPPLSTYGSGGGLLALAWSPDGRSLAVLRGVSVVVFPELDPDRAVVKPAYGGELRWTETPLASADDAGVDAALPEDAATDSTSDAADPATSRLYVIGEPGHPDNPALYLAGMPSGVASSPFGPSREVRQLQVSSDGTRLAFFGELGDPLDLRAYISDRHFGSLTELEDVAELGPWSPSGDLLVVFESGGALSTRRPDGSVGPMTPYPATPWVGPMWPCHWAPDGKHLACASKAGEIIAIDTSSSGAPPKVWKPLSGGPNMLFGWASNDEVVVGGLSGDGRAELVRASVGGMTLVSLSKPSTSVWSVLSLSHDGKRVLFFAEDGSPVHRDVYVASTSGATPALRVSTAAMAAPRLCVFSPDDASIACESGAGILLLSSSTSGFRVLLADPNARTPTWSPDGTELAFFEEKSEEDGVMRLALSDTKPKPVLVDTDPMTSFWTPRQIIWAP